MVIIGYTGSDRIQKCTEKKRLWLFEKAKASKSYFDRFLSFSEDEEDLPVNYFPLSGLGHDCGAAILKDEKIIASAAEERFNRKKHSISLDGTPIMPKQALEYCLQQAGKSIDEVDYICYYLDHSKKIFHEKIKILTSWLSASTQERVIKGNRLSYEREFCQEKVYERLVDFTGYEWPKDKLKFIPHHLAHAASAFYSSGFENSGILTLDGFGEKDSSIFALGSKNKIHLKEETPYPTSLGIIYMIVTVFLGFKALNDEYKVMGLASYGNPGTYKKQFADIIQLEENGQYNTNILVRNDLCEYFKEMFGPPREEKAAITQREMDIAASLQERLEEAVLHKLSHLKEKYDFQNLSLAGGVALNSTLNGKIALWNKFKNVYVFPAAADDGCSVGAAQYFYHNILEEKRNYHRLQTVYLGPQYGEREINVTLENYIDKIKFEKTAQIEEKAAHLLTEQKIIGWYQGKMEFGPRALGNRSILGDARNPDMKDIINEKVKWREPFRPFAPAVKFEAAKEYFEMGTMEDSPFMLFVFPVKEEKKKMIPATTHCDGSARIQTVKKEDNKKFWKLLDCFGRITGVPLVLNTSFNVKGEPIVCTPGDAVKCFLNTNIDVLIIDDYLIEKLK